MSNEELRQLEEYKSELESNLVDLEKWIGQRSNTLSWKIISRASEENLNCSTLLNSLNSTIDGIVPPKYEDLLSARKRFIGSLWRNLAISFFVSFLLISILKTSPEIMKQTYVAATLTQVIVISLILFLTSFIGSLISYYRNWSIYRRRVLMALNAIRNFEGKIQSCRKEDIRLKSMQSQTNDWLRLISLSLIEPMRFVDSAKQLPDDFSVEKFPLSLRLARAYPGDQVKQTQFSRETLRLINRKGWRSNVFNLLVKQAANLQGYDPLVFTPAMLDADLPEASNGSRYTLSKMLSEGEVQFQVGLEMIDLISHEVRNSVIPAIDIPVRSVHTDALDDLDWVVKVGTDDDWIDFLGEIFGPSNSKPPAFSTVPFSAAGQRSAAHQKYQSFALVPAKLEVQENEIKVIPHGESSPQWIDLALRVDLSGPYPQDFFNSISGDAFDAQNASEPNGDAFEN